MPYRKEKQKKSKTLNEIGIDFDLKEKRDGIKYPLNKV